MPKKILILACALLLGGCAVPVPLQIASWAIDGLIFITTEKTMADHGVSLVAQRDCAMLRVVTEGAFCRDGDPAAVSVAMLPPPEGNGALYDGMESTADGVIMTRAGEDVADRLAAFETAAGGGPKSLLRDADWLEAQVALVEEEHPSDAAALAAARWQAIIDAPSFFDHPTESVGFEPLPEPMAEQVVEMTPGSGFDTLEAARNTFADDRLYLGDSGPAPYLNGVGTVTILAAVSADFPAVGIGGDRGFPQIRANAQAPGWESHARSGHPPGRVGARAGPTNPLEKSS